MARVVVIGAGAMGLAAAYHALKAGHEVDLLEADDRPGGMAAHFDFDGLSIERFYHFVCKADRDTFALMEELGIGGLMRWRATSMGYFMQGRILPWGDPLSLLAFPHLNLVQKIRYGLQAFLSTKRGDWDRLEHVSARDWITAWCGRETYELMWRRLFDLKFYEYADNISAAWVATRIKRVGNSRKSLLQEELGYIEGGSETLVKALAGEIARRGGRIHLRQPARRVRIESGAVTGVEAGQGAVFPADHVVSTVPTPFVPRLIPDLPGTLAQRYEAIRNIGVVCVLYKLKSSLSPHFWINTIDPAIGAPGLVEFSNLRPLPHTVVYTPFYMPTTNPKFDRPDAEFAAETFAILARVNPALTKADVLAHYVGRLRHAQPVCEPGFKAKIPPVATPIRGLQIADTCFYYPEDRGISESVRLGHEMAARMDRPWPV